MSLYVGKNPALLMTLDRTFRVKVVDNLTRRI